MAERDKFLSVVEKIQKSVKTDVHLRKIGKFADILATEGYAEERPVVYYTHLFFGIVGKPAHEHHYTSVNDFLENGVCKFLQLLADTPQANIEYFLAPNMLCLEASIEKLSNSPDSSAKHLLPCLGWLLLIVVLLWLVLFSSNKIENRAVPTESI